MKKSGILVALPRAAAGASVDAVIAPEAHQVPVEVIAHGLNLALETATQLEHQLWVGGSRRHLLRATHLGERAVTQPARGERLDRRLRGARAGASPEIQRAHQLGETRRTY